MTPLRKLPLPWCPSSFWGGQPAAPWPAQLDLSVPNTWANKKQLRVSCDTFPTHSCCCCRNYPAVPGGGIWLLPGAKSFISLLQHPASLSLPGGCLVHAAPAGSMTSKPVTRLIATSMVQADGEEPEKLLLHEKLNFWAKRRKILPQSSLQPCKPWPTVMHWTGSAGLNASNLGAKPDGLLLLKLCLA